MHGVTSVTDRPGSGRARERQRSDDAGGGCGRPPFDRAGRRGDPGPRRQRGRRRGRHDAGQLRRGDDLHRARRRRLRHALRRGHPSGALRRLLRQRAGAGRQAGRARDRDRGDLRRSAGARTTSGRPPSPCRVSRPGPVTCGSAGVGCPGPTWWTRACRRRTAPRSRMPMPHCCPRSPRRCVSATVSRSTAPGRLAAAGRRPAAPPRPPSRVRAAGRATRTPSTAERTPTPWSSRWPTAARSSQEDLDTYRVIESVPRSVPVDGCTVHARGNDLDDVLGTLAAAAGR